MKKKILCFFGTVFIILTAGVFILLQPYLKTAFALGKIAKGDTIKFHAELCLNPDALSENERGLIDTLEWIFQVKEEDLLKLRFTGEKKKNEMTVRVYCNTAEYPLTELCYGENQKTINIKMFYEAIEEGLPDKLWLLKMLLPEWSLEEETITFEQLENAGIDLEAMLPLGKVQDLDTPSLAQCIYLLSRLEKEKDENGNMWFLINYENYALRLCTGENEAGTVIFLKGEAVGENQKTDDFEAEFTSDP